MSRYTSNWKYSIYTYFACAIQLHALSSFTSQNRCCTKESEEKIEQPVMDSLACIFESVLDCHVISDGIENCGSIKLINSKWLENWIWILFKVSKFYWRSSANTWLSSDAYSYKMTYFFDKYIRIYYIIGTISRSCKVGQKNYTVFKKTAVSIRKLFWGYYMLLNSSLYHK